MFGRKKQQKPDDATQPVDYQRLAKEVVKEQKRQSSSGSGCSCASLIILAAMFYLVAVTCPECVKWASQQVAGIIPSAPQVNWQTVYRQSPTNIPRAAPTVRRRQPATPVPRQSINQSSTTRNTTIPPTAKAVKSQTYLFHVCVNSRVNLRAGAGYSEFALAGEMQPGVSYGVIATRKGENVLGNTTWYEVEHAGKTAFVTAHYAFACDPPRVATSARRPSTTDPTAEYITSCNDKNMISLARSSLKFSHNEVRRAVAYCSSKQVMVELKINAVFDTLNEVKHEMYALLCALRQKEYGVTFDVLTDFVDVAGNTIESRAVLAQYETEMTNKINCDSYYSNVNWESAASSWWVHRALND